MKKQSETSVNELVDHLFRHNSGQMVSVLTRIFGFENIDLVEDAIQESLTKALKKWQFQGIPQNPSAWMIQAAKNHIIDQLRRNKKIDTGNSDILKTFHADPKFSIEEKFRYANELNEDLLCMMFAVCHPILKPDSQIALTLKTVGGFSVSEIAKAFLSNREAVAKMITRAKKTLKDKQIRLQIPPPDRIQYRLDAVLKVLYLMFNEGYSTSHGKELIRRDLCYEAIRLAQTLSDHPITRSPKIEALLALFFFQAARFETRHDESRDFLPLAEQERQLWDKKMINVGLYHLKRSAKGNEVSDYHLEAEIASCHVLAEDFDSTDWKRMLDCYEILLKRNFSAVIALNRIIVLSKVADAKVALRELERLSENTSMENYLPMIVATAQLQFENQMFDEAARSFEKSIEIAENELVRSFLEKKLKSSRKLT